MKNCKILLLVLFCLILCSCSDSSNPVNNNNQNNTDSTVHLLSPSNDTTFVFTPDSINITFSWINNCNAQIFHFQFGDSTFANTLDYLTYNPYNYTFNSTTSRFWRVRIYNPSPHSHAPWSSIRHFTIVP